MMKQRKESAAHIALRNDKMFLPISSQNPGSFAMLGTGVLEQSQKN